ncbi:hypothetical protein H1S01_14470 [Heliobacterium chlorum]|uniref:Uncharacterized protein n=1 Tax=Heliobacterium chlorum TaxID=2698 RepID=A0ABR7T6Q0_HELCL|nr:hypothetical protein [Heliobacterium chlorum]MBC9785693.1 hypothetical protein [Heliobacterium chlorum]
MNSVQPDMNQATEKGTQEISLEGFRSLIERLLELSKISQEQETNGSFVHDLTVMMETASLELTLLYLKEYTEGRLDEKYLLKKEKVAPNEPKR